MDHDEMAKANMRAVIQALINERDRLEAEIKRLRQRLDALAERHSSQEAKHYCIIRQLEAERDQWQRQAMNNG